MAASEAVRRRLERLFVDALNMEPPSADADLIERGLLDSLTLIELLHAIEQEFRIEIPLELDIERFRTIERLAEFVSDCSPSGAGAA
jgi:acyl carrier protein